MELRAARQLRPTFSCERLPAGGWCCTTRPPRPPFRRLQPAVRYTRSVVTETDAARIISLLQENRDDQRLQLARQAEALTLQREQFALVQRSQERAEKLQTRAEAMQDRSAQLIARSRKALVIIVPLVVLIVVVLAVSIVFRRW
jgi:hypothetical protein